MPTLHGLVDAWADRDPDRIALAGADGGLSYGDLRRRSSDLAARLAERGARPESFVVLHLDRSPDLIVAMLGVLKAGAAFLPVATDYPDARVTELISDSSAVLTLTAADIEAMSLDTGGSVPAVAVTGDSAAYLMYTSGSTGRPKGVVITHANAIGLVRDQDYADFAESETFLQLSPPSFDAAAFEIWGALTSGARLVLADASYQAIDALPGLLRTAGVTTLFLTPALFHELVRSRIDVFEGVRRVVVGGDVLAPDRASTFLAWSRTQPRKPVLVNGYGPTETTTFAVTHGVDTAGDGPIPIGRPLHGVRIYLLGPDLEPVPDGEEGDLWIAGSGVCRGYLGQPGSTARSFLPDPWSPVPGARMYRSGDRARLGIDGTITFLGRSDDQVKVRGFRVEPKEVELALLAMPAVREAAVVAEQLGDSDKRLAAYVVPADGVNDSEQIRDDLARRLPRHLVPTKWVLVAELPRTVSGKLDRNALRAPAPAESPAAEPDGRTQQILAEVWRDVLGVDHVGPDDDFFALGGDSMLAIRAITEAEARGARVTLLTMFSDARLREVAAAVDAHVAPANAGDQTETYETIYPASRLQLGLIFEAASSPDASLYHDVMAHRVEAPFDPDALDVALSAVTASHEALRTRFDLGHHAGAQQVVEDQGPLPVELRDLRGLDTAARDQALDELAAHVGRPFDVEIAPLLRVAVALLDDAFYLVYGFHHAIMDGWSDTVFLRDLMSAYRCAVGGGKPAVEVHAFRYRDFVRLEADTLASPGASQFWRRRCEELTPTIVAPQVNRPGGAAHRVSRLVRPRLRAELESAAARWRVPVKSVAVAAHLATIGRVTGVGRPTTGLPVNGRPEVPGADRLIGLFLNIIPLSAGSTDASWAELARNAFEAERAATEFRRYPYPAIRQVAGRPLFDVLCNFAHFRLTTALVAEGLVSDTRTWDRTSYPLVVDMVLDGPDRLRIDVTGACDAFTEADLDDLWTAHAAALEALVAEPTGPVRR